MKYSTIVVDPPWPVKKIIRKTRPNQVADLDYSTMSLEEIQKLPIQKIAADNSVLFLWTTHKYLPYAFDIMSAWGFKYQRTLTWDKRNGISLFGFHHRTEFLLFGYKGHLDIYPRRKTIPTLLVGKSLRHSAKPDSIMNLIKDAYPEPRLELFARGTRDGFDVWGDEAEQAVVLEFVEYI